VSVRATVSVVIPLDTTAGQLRALASLLATVGAARWEKASVAFDKLDRNAAQLPEALETMLGQLADQLRIAGRERETLGAKARDTAPAPAGARGA
jgi:hypothetical protein